MPFSAGIWRHEGDTNAVYMVEQSRIVDFVTQNQVNSPRQQKIVEPIFQLKAARHAHLGCIGTEIDIGTWAVVAFGARSEYPCLGYFGVFAQDGNELFASHLG